VVPRESVDASAAVWTDASTSVSARVQAYGFCAELSGVSRRADALAVGASSSVHADGATRLAVCT
jgi:hypothetical protein